MGPASCIHPAIWDAAVAAMAGGDGAAAAGPCGAPAAGSRVQGSEHAFQGNLAVRGIDELADLIPVDRAGLEIEGEPAARAEVRRRVEPLVREQRGPFVAVRLEVRPQGRLSVPEKTPKIFLPARNVGRPQASTSTASGKSRNTLRTSARYGSSSWYIRG
jgi:hypothetical protein